MDTLAHGFVPMRVQARPGSAVEHYYAALQRAALAATASAAAGQHDLVFHGGRRMPQATFMNVYLGGTASWAEDVIDSIERSIERALQHPDLEAVMAQYFDRRPACERRTPLVMQEPPPAELSEQAVRDTVRRCFDAGMLAAADLDSCVFNLVLPAGALLQFGPHRSTQGLAGFHGGIPVERGGTAATLYYSANVCSQLLPDGTENGLAAFDLPWKNIAATLYHEINEFRTDPDVEAFARTGQRELLGWMSPVGHEIGDQPLLAAGHDHLDLVFHEVMDTTSGRTVPIQLMYSNEHHGAHGA